ncbi:MAG: PD-(D/E)XK nuclease family protein, partial [Spirochaetales bacterium]|nr:PD-(D/E)XK nuclease family protein [Spirochaetales bacterium]
ALTTVSVSKYLDMMEEKGDPDDRITDADDQAAALSGAKASQVGTAVHSFFEKNVHNLASAEPEKFDVPQSMRSRFLAFAKAGLAVPEYQSLIAGAEVLMPETAMVFHTPEGKLLNGVIDLIVRKGNHITVLDYKTHTGDSLEPETLERYKNQVALYAQGLKAIWPECTFDGCLLVMYSTGASELVRC